MFGGAPRESDVVLKARKAAEVAAAQVLRI